MRGRPILRSHSPVPRKVSVSGGKLHEPIGRFARLKAWAENTVVCTAEIRFDCHSLGLPGWIGNLKKADEQCCRRGNTTKNDWNLLNQFLYIQL